MKTSLFIVTVVMNLFNKKLIHAGAIVKNLLILNIFRNLDINKILALVDIKELRNNYT